MQNISATTPHRRGRRFRRKENVTKGRRKYKGINSAARQYDRGEGAQLDAVSSRGFN